MKYLVMIRKGHVPMWGPRVNRDVEPFLRYFLRKGSPSDVATLTAVARHLHLAFKGMDVEEIYAVLTAQLVEAIGKYDPDYTRKVKGVVEVIDNELREQERFTAVDVGRYLEFDCARDLRLLCRRGFLAAESGQRVWYSSEAGGIE